MPTKRRKVEVHRLTISGLPEGQSYGSFLQDLRANVRRLSRLVMTYGEKSHALQEAHLQNRRLLLRFLSFTTGHRPDILDTERFSLLPNPLSPNQTGVEWTHAVGGMVRGRYLLLIEKVQTGIFPNVIEKYLQWMVDEFHRPEGVRQDAEDVEPITISLEAEPDEEFIQRMDAMTRITKATVRTVRPNPGWADLESELAGEAQASDAHKAEVTMRARRRSSLAREGGIIGAIRRLFRQRELDYASIEGERQAEKDSFSTDRLGKYRYISMALDDRGQVRKSDAWEKLSRMMDDLD